MVEYCIGYDPHHYHDLWFRRYLFVNDTCLQAGEWPVLPDERLCRCGGEHEKKESRRGW